ncbi:MAG TPA: radical SAM protein [Methanoregulaceae archaeon]|nr:radical SAM protein [Methanoregulaceae archaeon]
MTIGLCADCIRSKDDTEYLKEIHARTRKEFGLLSSPPENPAGVRCRLCANECSLGEGESGFCGLIKGLEGRAEPQCSRKSALAYMYLDPLPTNCCAAWFCPGSDLRGYNLAVFFYGCNFDCLFCQNASHKGVRTAPAITEDELIAQALDPRVRCVCFFGGSPEPQLPFAVRVSKRIRDESGRKKPVCWEWNGAGNTRLAERAATLSMEMGGTIKFDLKASHPNLHLALCGTGNKRTLHNFERIAEKTQGTDTLTATTLLVPHYIEAEEVEKIAGFIGGIDSDIPYSLLAFHPAHLLADLPFTSHSLAESCVTAARMHLNRVHVGNMHLLK